MPENKTSILFTCIGRRVCLLEQFRRAAAAMGRPAEILGTDTTELSPALQLCDKKFTVPPVTDPSYIQRILDAARDNSVNLLVPTVDLDLKLLAQNKDRFQDLGCRVLISDTEVIDVCQDKNRTYQFLRDNDFDTPLTMTVQSALERKSPTWPCFLKPRDGYAGRGSAVVNNPAELSFFAERIPNCIVQEFVSGTEYTCDVYVDFGMNIRCVVPRKRIEVRAGEVSKGQVVKDMDIIRQAADVVKKLGAGPGVITLQLFRTEQGRIRFIEANPRFGGGVVLSIQAGADFPAWILGELFQSKGGTGEPANRPPWQTGHCNLFNGYQDGLTMLRYDSAVWM